MINETEDELARLMNCFIIKVTGTFHFGLITTLLAHDSHSTCELVQANNKHRHILAQDEVGAAAITLWHASVGISKRRDENKSNTCPIFLSSLFRDSKQSYSWGLLFGCKSVTQNCGCSDESNVLIINFVC